MIGALTCPVVVTLDAEVVVRTPCQLTHSCPTLKESLSQRDAGRDVVLLHLFDGYVFVFLDICLVG